MQNKEEKEKEITNPLEFKKAGDVIDDVRGNKYVITKTGFAGIPIDMIPVRDYVLQQIQNITVTYHGTFSDPLAQGEAITLGRLIDRFVENYLEEHEEEKEGGF